MHKAKPLFFVGNKRSGTTIVDQFLNYHPNIGVTYESDLVWILYQIKYGNELKPYPLDGPKGFYSSVEACRHLLPKSSDFDIADVFFRCTRELLKNGSPMQRTTYNDKDGAIWLGDKKPVQNCDPKVVDFIETNFKKPRYIHLVRHPIEVVASIEKLVARGSPVPECWQQPKDVLLARWFEYEQWVARLHECVGDRLLSVRFEDLLSDPCRVMVSVFDHLSLRMTPVIRQQISSVTKIPKPYNDPQLIRMMEAYADNPVMQKFDYSLLPSTAKSHVKTSTLSCFIDRIRRLL